MFLYCTETLASYALHEVFSGTINENIKRRTFVKYAAYLKKVWKRFGNVASARQSITVFQSSIYISKIIAPMHDCAVDGDAVFDKSSILRLLSRSIATQRVDGSYLCHFDTFFLQRSARKFENICPK